MTFAEASFRNYLLREYFGLRREYLPPYNDIHIGYCIKCPKSANIRLCGVNTRAVKLLLRAKKNNGGVMEKINGVFRCSSNGGTKFKPLYLAVISAFVISTIFILTGCGANNVAKTIREPRPAVSLLSIEVSNYRDEYYIGDVFPADMVIIGEYKNLETGLTTTADVTERAEYSGYKNTPGTYTITVTVKNEPGVSATFNVTVLNVELTHIAITTRPTKIVYIQNETLALAGMVVSVNYNNGTVNSNFSGYTATPANGAVLSTVGIQTITVSANGKTATTTVNVTNDFEFETLNTATVTLGGDDYSATKNLTIQKFAMSKYQTTQAQFEAVMGYKSSSISSYYGIGDNYPVYYVSWYEAVQCALRLTLASNVPQSVKDHIGQWKIADTTKMSGTQDEYNKCMAYLDYARTTNGCYRLPTEAEWEYALCGESRTTNYVWGDTHDQTEANIRGWNVDNNANGGYSGGTKPVGLKQSTAFDLKDMLGNVSEWCIDAHTNSSDTIDYKAGTMGSNRVVRGGSWNDNSPTYFRSAYRSGIGPSLSSYLYGFRLARTVL